MKNSALTSVRFNKILITIFVIVLLIIAGAFGYGLLMVREHAIEVTRNTQDAVASEKQVEQLAELQQRLAQTQSLVSKADQIYATPDTYQARAVTDLQKYASVAGIGLGDIGFAQGDTPLPDARRVTVSFDGPISYERLIRFLQLIEGSMPKMQVASLSVGRPPQAQSDLVTVGDIIINVSVR